MESLQKYTTSDILRILKATRKHKPFSLNYTYVNFVFKKQNHNSVIIYLKFWSHHESRNQLKVWYTATVKSNFEQVILNICRELEKSQYKKWFPTNLDYYINNYLLNNLNDLSFITDIDKIVLPNKIHLHFWKINESNLQNEITNLQELVSDKIRQINKYENKLQKIKIKLNNKKFLYKWNWFWNWKNSTKIEYENYYKLLKKEYNTYSNKKEIWIEKLNDVKTYNYYLNNTPTQFSNNIEGSNEHDLVFYPINWAFNNFEMFKNKKGIYIFHNLNNNKYYVGQSKNLYKRIFLDHFDYKTGVCKNPNFCDDYNYNKHDFRFAYKLLNTKDELDYEEKKYINIFDSFNFGYNKTSGNI